MFTTKPQHLLPLAPLCACIALGACGGSAKQRSSTSTSTTAAHATPTGRAERLSAAALASLPPDTVLARVGAEPVTASTVAHLISIMSAPAPVPDPPTYASCIAQEQAAAAEKSITGAAAQPEAELRQTCEESYQKVLREALSSALHALWLSGEAAEEHLSVSPEEVKEEFDQDKKVFHSEAEFRSYRESERKTVADMMSELKLGKIASAIYQRIKAVEHPTSQAEVAAYYNAHLASTYTIPEGRRVRILRTTTEASAQQAKQELQAGKSFAALAKGLSGIAQPISAIGGEIPNLSPDLLAEPVLNNAIFSAKLDQLSGPVTVIARHKTIAKESGSGSYVFEVIGIVPAKRIPLPQVKARIAQSLSLADKTNTLAAGVAAFRKKWRARTDCTPGYVVANCRQYTGSPPVDPYTL